MCSTPASAPPSQPAHTPSYVSSMGNINVFRSSRKPRAASKATNCFSCFHEPNCQYSAKKIYIDKLRQGNASWPVNIVVPDMEDVLATQGQEAAEAKLEAALSEDYTPETPLNERLKRPWFGRCVWECDNNVCDDQVVTMQWDDDPLPDETGLQGRISKSATFHMIAQTDKQCERRGRVYGTQGEIEYDSANISIVEFATGKREDHFPHQPGGGHGGGDEGLVRQFVRAVNAAKNEGIDPVEAQRKFLGCTLEELVRSHAMVWAAEEARNSRSVVGWNQWWSSLSS
jgi:hypothetical protein